MSLIKVLFQQKAIIAISLAVLTGFAHAAEAPDPELLQQQLDAVEEEIQRFKKLLETTRDQKTDVESTLEQNERSINQLLNQIRNLQDDIDSGEEKVQELQERQAELDAAKAEQQTLIAKQLVAAYKMGKQQQLKVLLNQEDPNELSRMLTYYDYFNEARAAEIERYTNTIAELDAVKSEIVKQNQQLIVQADELQTRKAELLIARQEKETSLTALNQEIQTAGTEITRLQGNREQLETLLRQIERRLARLPSPAEVTPFGTLKGKMYLPVDGRITRRFGNTRIAGKLKWDGMLIAADAGVPVKAIHYGHVVFSDWLRGFGLLIIINHGDGYMSLYGHNQVLYREAGDWVTAGETIATVGDSGGQTQTGLYFEIRVAGKPENPQLWCKARDSNAA